MKIIWYASAPIERETAIENRIYNAFSDGLRRDRARQIPIKDFRGRAVADIACFYGVSGAVREIMEAYHSARKHVIIFDKGMYREKNQSPYHRVQIDDGNPLKCLMRRGLSHRRARQRGIRINKRTQSFQFAPIVLATNSQKHDDFWGIADGAAYDRQIVDEIRKHSSRPIIYRPKPKRLAFPPIQGTTYSTKPEGIEDVLLGAHLLVTHSSACAVNAILMGVPAICLGRCAATPVSGNSLETIEDPFFPEAALLRQWLACLMWFEWTMDEFESGEAWRFIRPEMKRVRL